MIMRGGDVRHEKQTRVISALPSGAALAAAAALAAEALAAGKLAAFPTETVYGLGADASSGEAVAGIYAAKSRPAFNPLIAHVSSAEKARKLGIFNEDALKLAKAFWPGPLTLVVPICDECPVSDLARAGLPSLAIRVPAHPVAQAILEAFGRPVVAPSANRSGRISPTTAAHVLEELDGRCDIIVDGGPCAVGLESTIVSCLETPPRILRPGGVTLEELQSICPGTGIFSAEAAGADGGAEGDLLAPGMMASHYAPRARVRLNARDIHAGEAVLDFAGQLAHLVPAGAAHADLSPQGDLREAAARLFACLRALDAGAASTIAVAPVPATGLGAAINDRLKRAAAER